MDDIGMDFFVSGKNEEPRKKRRKRERERERARVGNLDGWMVCTRKSILVSGTKRRKEHS